MAEPDDRPPTSERPAVTEHPQPDTGDGSHQATKETTVHTMDPPTGETQDRKRWRFVGSFPFLVLVALAVAILIKTFLVQAFYIPSPSMDPTLQQGDRVLVYKLAYHPGRQDVVVFVNPNGSAPPDRGPIGGFLHWLGEGIGVAQPEDEDFIKRVIGLPGETLEIRDRTVFIDGEPLAEPYLTPGAKTCNRPFGPVTVPDDALFVMGDNRCNSADSRYGLGFVPVEKVVGRAFVIIWPPSNVGGLG